MNVADLEQRWKSLRYTSRIPYKSLRISPECVADLFIAMDMKGHRYIILQVPSGVSVNCPGIELQNLSIEWHEETRFILIGLRNEHYIDLYNELVLSLYSKIKDVSSPSRYTNHFIESFEKWAQFFDHNFLIRLTDSQVKGILGELITLRYYLKSLNTAKTNDILVAWQGPYDRAQDFVFSSIAVEVKTKDVDQIAVRISSEFQLQPESGKDLQIAVIDVLRHQDGVNLTKIIAEVKEIIAKRGADLAIFLKTLAKVGLVGDTVSLYDSLCWKPVSITFYQCNNNTVFPRITASEIPDAISKVKYNLTVSFLEDFIIKRIEF